MNVTHINIEPIDEIPEIEVHEIELPTMSDDDFEDVVEFFAISADKILFLID